MYNNSNPLDSLHFINKRAMNTVVHVHVVVKLYLQLLFAKIILLLNNFCKYFEEISNV